MKNIKLVEKLCENCGSKFRVMENDKQKFCSAVCFENRLSKKVKQRRFGTTSFSRKKIELEM